MQVQKVKDKCQIIVNEIETDKAKAEEKLEEAKPALLVYKIIKLAGSINLLKYLTLGCRRSFKNN